MHFVKFKSYIFRYKQHLIHFDKFQSVSVFSVVVHRLASDFKPSFVLEVHL